MKKNNQRFNKENEVKIEYTRIFKVKRSDVLLPFLLNNMGQSRNNVKALLSHHQVLVNGVVVTQFDFPLAHEDEVKIAKNPVREEQAKKNAPVKRERLPKIEIIYEDDYYIAINKPAGLLSVESDKETLSAYKLLSEFMMSESKNYRPFVIHRIDKETSGVLVFAKDPKTQSILRLNWNDYIIKRKYTAVVCGTLPKKEDQIRSYLKMNKNNLMYSTNDPTGELAITNYRVISQSKEYSLVDVLIDTGRKNQIRVHMSELGCPIVGDDKYPAPKNPLKRLGLHAGYLEFKDPNTGEIISIDAKAPGTFYSLFAKN